MPEKTKNFVALGLLLSALGVPGCNGFQSQWELMGSASMPTDDIVGQWEGRWSSEVSSHSGSMRCLVARVDEHHYVARYRAKFMSLFTADYSVILDVKHAKGQWEFSGESDLGWLGGVYRHEGRISDGRYLAKYSSKRDNGVIGMWRPNR